MQLTELHNILTNTYPIHNNQEGFRYTDPYVQIEAEFKKIGSLYHEKPNYEKVIKLSSDLIQQGCTHLFIYTALAHAMCQVYQWPGFTESVMLIDTQLREHWDHLFPSAERLRGRIAPIQGLSERWQKFLAGKPLQALNAEMINRLITTLKNLDAICTERFTDQINIMSLIHPFEEQQKRLEQDKAQNEARQKADAERQQQEQEINAQSQVLMAELEVNAEPVSADELLNTMNTQELYEMASNRLLAENLDILRNDPFNYAIYKHNRAAIWWRQSYRESELLDVINQQGLKWETYSAALLEKAKGRHQDALLLFEQLSHQHPFFLDLQLHLCDCLVALKAEAPLLALIKHEVQQLCAYYKNLEHARINREIKVIDAHTQAYFEVFNSQP